MNSDEKAQQPNQIISATSNPVLNVNQHMSGKSSHINDSNDQSYTILQAASISAKKHNALTAQGNSV